MSQNALTQYDLEELARPLMGLLNDFQDHFIGWMVNRSRLTELLHILG